MDLVEENHEVPQVGVRVVLAANGLGGGLYSSRPSCWDVHGTVVAVRGNLISNEFLEGFRVLHGNRNPYLGPSARHYGKCVPQCLPLSCVHVY